MAAFEPIPCQRALFDLPDDAETYLHRAGRTARLGRPGTVLSLVGPQEVFALERYVNKLGVAQLTQLSQDELRGGPAAAAPPPSDGARKPSEEGEEAPP